VEVQRIFPAFEMEEQFVTHAQTVLAYIRSLRAELAPLHDAFEDPRLVVALGNQQRKVEHLIRELVALGFYADRTDVWNQMRYPKEYGKIPYPTFQKRVLGRLGWYEEVLEQITDGSATNTKEAITMQREQSRAHLRRGLGRKPR